MTPDRTRVADAIATALAALPDRTTRRAVSTATALGVAVVDRLEAVREIRAQNRPTGIWGAE